MNSDDGPVVVLALPDGTAAAFPVAAVIEARQRAVELGFAPRTTANGTSVTEPLMDSKQLGALFACDPTTVEALAKRGAIPSIRLGRLLRFEPAACVARLRVTDGGRP